MGRRSGIGGVVTAIARAHRAGVAAQKRAVRDHERAVREHARATRQYERERAAHDRVMEREAKRQYLQDQLEAADDQTAALAATVEALDLVLSHTLDVDDRIDFDSLRLPLTEARFQPPPHLSRSEPAPRPDAHVSLVQLPGFFSRLLPGWKAHHQEKLREAQGRDHWAVSQHEIGERARVAALNAAREQHEKRTAEALAKARQRNAEVDELESAYLRGDAEAIVIYNTMVLERSDYPADMPQQFRIEYDVSSRELVIDYELPDSSIIPAVAEVRYIKSKDQFEEKPRRAIEVRERYQKLVASIALRTVHEVFEADHANHVNTVTFSGFGQAVDPATGQDSRDYLVQIRAARAEFESIDLSRVDPAAGVSRLALATRSQVKAMRRNGPSTAV